MSQIRDRPDQQGEPLFKSFVHETRVVGPREAELTLKGTIKKSGQAPTPEPVLRDSPDSIIKKYLTSE